MGCFLERDEQKGTVQAVLSFSRVELLYDIENIAFIEGERLRSMRGEGLTVNDELVHNVHILQDIGQKGNVDRVTRVLDITMAKCREMLYQFTKHAIHRPALDNKLKEQEVYGIVLSVPEDFSQTTLNLLERTIHEYLVCTSVADWMSMTYPEKAEIWAIKAASAERDITTLINTRTSKMRRRVHPF